MRGNRKCRNRYGYLFTLANAPAVTALLTLHQVGDLLPCWFVPRTLHSTEEELRILAEWDEELCRCRLV